jgi:hypothetical protein
MAVTALAIPAASMMPVAPAAQPDLTKIAQGSMKDAVKAPEPDAMENQEPFHSLMEELSLTEKNPATRTVKREVTNVPIEAAPKSAPPRIAAWSRLPTQVLPAATEKTKSKPAKREANNDPAAPLPAAAPAKESKPPIVWSFPQIQAIVEATSQQAAAPNAEYARTDVENDGVRGITGDNRQPKPSAKPTARGTAPGEAQVLPAALPEEPPPGRRIASSIADTNSDAATPASVIEPDDSPSADPFTRTVPTAPTGDATTAKVAFEARLRPILPVQAAPQDIGSQPRPVQPQPSPFKEQAQGPSNTPRPAAVAASAEKHNDNQRDQPERQPKSAAPSEAQAPSLSAAASHVETASSTATNSMEASNAVSAPAVSSASVPAPVAAQPASHTPTAAPDAAPTGDPPSSPASANDIKIALNDNGQRVELRVTERAGDIHVTVRTPDSQLATAMREDLPALSSKLEQSGLHSEMWRPPASVSSENRAIETSGGNASPDSREQSGGRQQQEGRQQDDPRNPQQTLNRKSDRKEFSWLFESIR